MKNFLAHLKAAWNYARFIPLISSIDHEDEWNVEDAAAFSSWANSPSGLKLRNRARRLISLSAVNATQASQNDLIKRCGWSSGVTAAFSWQDSHLSQAGAQSSKSEASEKDASDYFDTLRP